MTSNKTLNLALIQVRLLQVTELKWLSVLVEALRVMFDVITPESSGYVALFLFVMLCTSAFVAPPLPALPHARSVVVYSNSSSCLLI